jgi:acyl-coenzyme A thioesterase PaaI-like protein
MIIGARSDHVPEAIQDSIPHNHCWGCGTLNPRGLRIKSHPEGDGAVCRFQPSPDHMAGPTHVVNGGIIAAVVDCHSICTAIADSYRVAGRELGSEPLLWSVTASLKIEYLAPTPITAPMELHARVRETRGRRRIVECTVRSGGRDCARAEVVAVEVPAAWREGG